MKREYNTSTPVIIFISYNPKIEGFSALLNVFHMYSVVVVDNGSSLIQSEVKGATLLSQSKNIGFSKAANVGMKRAFDKGAKWAIVCNQDIELTRAGVLKFTKELEHCEPGIVGPEGGSLDPKRWTTILASRPGLEARSVHYISGSLMAIHRDVWKATGGFFEPYFMYYEDADICVRAKKAGFRLRQMGLDGFGHESHGSQGKNYYLARNHLWFVLRNAPLRVKLYEFIRLPKTFLEFFL